MLATLNQSAGDLGILKRQQALVVRSAIFLILLIFLIMGFF